MAMQLEKRWKLLEAFGQDLRTIRNRIEFERIPLSAIMKELHDSTVGLLWDGVAEKLYSSDFASIWKNELYDLHGSLLAPLKEEDMDVLTEFGRRLGEAESVSMQLSQIDMTLERLRECALETKSEIGKKSRLFRTLGTMAGFAIMIVLW